MNLITLLPGGERFEARDGETVLAAALRAGHLLAYSCRSGNCGSCRAVVDGQWHYRAGTAPLGLTDAERAQRMALLCQVVPTGPLTVTARPVAVADAPTVQSLPARVARVERLAATTVALYLKLPAVERMHYRAGQFLDVILPGGKRRSYSMAGAPVDGAPLELHIRERPGGAFTRAAMQTGTLLRVEGPLGTFFLRDASDPVLMLAGSTGFAPFKAMLEEQFRAGTDRRIELWWGVSEPDGLYHAELLDAWQRDHPSFKWHGVVGGRVHEHVFDAHRDGLGGFDVYMAGPPPMVRAAREAFAAAGVPDERMYFDPFEPAV